MAFWKCRKQTGRNLLLYLAFRRRRFLHKMWHARCSKLHRQCTGPARVLDRPTPEPEWKLFSGWKLLPPSRCRYIQRQTNNNVTLDSARTLKSNSRGVYKMEPARNCKQHAVVFSSGCSSLSNFKLAPFPCMVKENYRNASGWSWTSQYYHGTCHEFITMQDAGTK